MHYKTGEFFIYYNNYAAPPRVHYEHKEKPYKVLLITAASITAVIAVALIVYFAFFHNIVSLARVGRAMNIIGREAEERVNHTPFKAVTMLGDVLADGTVTTEVNYSFPILGNFLTLDVNGKAVLSSDLHARNFALEAIVEAFGTAIELDAFMNRERLALRLPVLDDSYYGIRYDSFRDDIRVFGSLIMLNDEVMDEWADHVDMINVLLNYEIVFFDESPVDFEPVRNLVKNLKVRNRRTRIESGGENINCRLIEIKITGDVLKAFLKDAFAGNQSNESMQSLFHNMAGIPLFQDVFGGFSGSFEDTTGISGDLLTDFEQYYSGDIVFSFFIDRGDRLLRAEIITDIEYDHSPVSLAMTFDFGNSIEDDWMFDLAFESPDTAEKLSIVWSFDEHVNIRGSTGAATHISTMIVTTDMNDPTTVISEWNIDKGDFTLTLINGNKTSSVEGSLMTDNCNFHLIFDNLFSDDPKTNLKITISTDKGAQIDEITFINLDKWNTVIVESAISLIFGRLFS